MKINRFLLAVGFLVVAIATTTRAQIPNGGLCACSECTALATLPAPTIFGWVMPPSNLNSPPDALYDCRQAGGDHIGNTDAPTTINAAWTIPPNWRALAPGDIIIAIVIDHGWLSFDSGVQTNQDLEAMSGRAICSYRGRTAPLVTNLTTGHVVKWAPILEQNSTDIIPGCGLGGLAGRTFVIGYDVYRLSVTAFPTPTMREFLTNGYVGNADVLRLNFNVPDPDGFSGSDLDTSDHLTLINPDGLPDTNDEILVYTDDTAGPEAAWYRLQPVVRGSQAFYTTGTSSSIPIPANRVDLDGDTVPESVDIQRDGFVEFIDPSGRGLGLTYANEIASSPDPGLGFPAPTTISCSADPIVDGEVNCRNGADDDSDTLVDCADPDCFGNHDCLAEICGNGLDDDVDGSVDCADPDCSGLPACTPEDCSNGVDDNGDTLADCADPTCAGGPPCVPENCGNGIDDDGDTLVDCADTADCVATMGTGSATDSDPCSLGIALRWDPATFPSGAGTYNVYRSTVSCGAALTGPPVVAGLAGTTYTDNATTAGTGYFYVIEPVDSSPGACPPARLCLGPVVDAASCAEICGNGIDDDGNTLTDCADPACAGPPGCVEICGNGIDDDGDTLTDCADPTCAGLPSCTEDCGNRIDDDGDTLVDCADTADCAATLGAGSATDIDPCSLGILVAWDPATFPSGAGSYNVYRSTVSCGSALIAPPVVVGLAGTTYTDSATTGGTGYFYVVEAVDSLPGGCPAARLCLGPVTDEAACGEICGNGFDDDGNTLTDCADPACAGLPTCVEICGNGIDDDADTLVDCADPTCGVLPSCVENCGNGIDDDGDTLTDCADSGDCGGAPPCLPENCTNGIDDDGDTLTDCADVTDCGGAPPCLPENCTNGIDDDGDTLTDCADTTDCGGAPPCLPENCTNGTDEDGDTLIDCLDPDCFLDPACIRELCANGTDDDGDTLVDCLDPDCCTDAACSGPPPEITMVTVRKAGIGVRDVVVSWFPAAPARAGAVFDVLSGCISRRPVPPPPGPIGCLWQDRGFANVDCIANDSVPTSLPDARLVTANIFGYYYLVREQSACGVPGTYGQDSLGAPRVPGSRACSP